MDIGGLKAEPVEFLPPEVNSPFGFVRWLEERESLFGMWGVGYGAVGVGGELLTYIPAPPPGPFVSTLAFPVRGTRTALVWRQPTGLLNLRDIDSGQENPLLSLPGIMDLDLSHDGTRLAYTRKLADRVDVVLLTLDGLNEQILTSFPGVDAAVCCLSWSPDDAMLFLNTGTAKYPQGVRTDRAMHSALVISQSGSVIWEATGEEFRGTVHMWAGRGQLLVLTAWTLFEGRTRLSEGHFIDLATGAQKPSITFQGRVQCFSPSGRFGVVLRSDDSLDVLDLRESRTVMSVRTGSYTGSCDWTSDEELVVISSGGN
jgi:hypothetical protein